jgi:A/G-specific adenine glycosylase
MRTTPVSLSAAAKRRLLAWFDHHARPLPWRTDRDPYRIWLSEVMLQQTTVAAVTPRYERFLTAFPTIRSLAAADEQSVLKEWEGLGYYSRARNLHRAARMLVANHTGAIADDPDAFAQLPGVGRYIFGAVLSQAFDRRLPIVEANTTRVLSRLFGQCETIASPAARKWLWQAAEAILPKRRVGDFNQALMELGSEICTPISPSCGRCPLSSECVARKLGLQESIPRKQPRPPTEEIREICLVVRHAGRVLLARRPTGGRWAKMWEFPRAALLADETFPAGTRRLIRSLGLVAAPGKRMMSIRYSVTRFRMTMDCFETTTRVAAFRSEYYEEGRWLAPAELDGYPVSSPQRKLAAAIQLSSI